MVETLPDDAGEISAKPMAPAMASFVRPIMTFFGVHQGCRFKVCRRANACATRHVVCYQALEEEMKPIVRSIQARRWMKAVERGEEPRISPAGRGDTLRLLAWEDAEIGRIESGAYGDEPLMPYQLWLKNYAAQDTRPPARADATPGRDGQPYDPDATLSP